MMQKIHVLVAGAAAALLLGACSFVTVEPEAEDVRVVEAGHVGGCERVGRTRVSVADRVLVFNRGEDSIRHDLDILARNSAADMGGDTVYLDGDVSEGRALYQVYNCGN